MATKTTHSHNYQHFDDLQLSAQAFYDELAADIGSYQFPGVTCARRQLGDGNYLWGPKRDYLELSFQSLRFYVCAAPFGRSFFVSWWLQETETGTERFLNRIFGAIKKTFYQMDTEAMFLGSVSAVIASKVGRLKADHGFREPQAGA